MELPAILGFALFLLILILGLTFYLNRKDISLEVKQDKKEQDKGQEANEKQGEQKQGSDIKTYDPILPYATDPILSVDDYEYNMVFKEEGDKGITKAQRDMLMSQYPMDWSVQPPSSTHFQQGLAKFKEAFENPNKSKTEFSDDLYKEVDGSNMQPPDTSALEEKEREILATYKPKDPENLKTYDAADAKEIIRRIYESKGVIAEYKEERPGVFVIVNTMPKDQKVVWEDDTQPGPTEQVQATATTEANKGAGEDTIVVPQVAMDVAKGLDPFFTPSTKTRDGKWDYTSWTPGLERMFAPTEARTNWF